MLSPYVFYSSKAAFLCTSQQETRCLAKKFFNEAFVSLVALLLSLSQSDSYSDLTTNKGAFPARKQVEWPLSCRQRACIATTSTIGCYEDLN